MDITVHTVKVFDKSLEIDTFWQYVFRKCGACLLFNPHTATQQFGYSAFSGNNYIQYIVIPDTVSSIGDGAFQGCDRLKEVILPDSVDTLGNYTFRGCKSLSVVRLSSQMATIPLGMFTNCSNLKHIVIPDGITRIEQNAFSYSSLRDLYLPASLDYIHHEAFYSAWVNTIHFAGTEDEWKEIGRNISCSRILFEGS